MVKGLDLYEAFLAPLQLFPIAAYSSIQTPMGVAAMQGTVLPIGSNLDLSVLPKD